MSVWTSLLGTHLTSKDGQLEIDSALNGVETVGFYFSAHWCPPCRGFTPELVNFYKDIKAKNKSFEIVFVSSDKSQGAFDEYYAEMPWLALPYDKRDLKSKLSSKYKVNGIPTLVILDSSGNVITKNGRERVSADAEGTDFPWLPTTLAEDLGAEFSSKTRGETVPVSALSGKFLGLYFSAHWCGPCRSFTPKLAKYYDNLKAAGRGDFEIIFCSSDESAQSFEEYYSEMPWLTLPFEDKRIQKLSSRFEVEGIPTLVIIDPAGQVVTKSARQAIEADPAGKKFPYHPELVADLSAGVESFGFDINQVPALVAFVDSADDSEQASARDALTPHALALTKGKLASPDGPEMLFFISTSNSALGKRVRDLTKLGEDSTAVVILDIPDGGGFYVLQSESGGEVEITEDKIAAFISAYKAKTLERKQLQ